MHYIFFLKCGYAHTIICSHIYIIRQAKKCGLIIFKVVHAGMRAKSDNFHVYNIASSQSPKPPKYRRRGRWRRKRNRDTQWLKICMIFKNLSFWMFCIVFCFCLLCFLIGKMRTVNVMMLLHFMRQYHTLKFSRARIFNINISRDNSWNRPINSVL